MDQYVLISTDDDDIYYRTVLRGRGYWILLGSFYPPLSFSSFKDAMKHRSVLMDGPYDIRLTEKSIPVSLDEFNVLLVMND